METVQSIVRAHGIELSAEDRDRLDSRFFQAGLDPPRSTCREAGLQTRRRRDGEVVLIMGLPGAGKSTIARAIVGAGICATEPRRGRRIAARSAARSPASGRGGPIANRARQHLHVACVARACRPGREHARPARAMRLARDQRRGRAGECRLADHREPWTPARAGGDEAGGQARHQRVCTDRAVPPSARARASGSGRRILADRRRCPSSERATRRSPTRR